MSGHRDGVSGTDWARRNGGRTGSERGCDSVTVVTGISSLVYVWVGRASRVDLRGDLSSLRVTKRTPESGHTVTNPLLARKDAAGGQSLAQSLPVRAGHRAWGTCALGKPQGIVGTTGPDGVGAELARSQP